MEDQKAGGGETPEASSASDAWKEVGSRLEKLGESLASTVEAAWKDEQVRDQAQEMKSGLESLVKQVGAAIKQTAESDRVQHAAQDTGKSLREAGEQTVQELRPHLLDALQQLDQELQKLINGIESRDQQSGSN